MPNNNRFANGSSSSSIFTESFLVLLIKDNIIDQYPNMHLASRELPCSDWSLLSRFHWLRRISCSALEGLGYISIKYFYVLDFLFFFLIFMSMLIINIPLCLSFVNVNQFYVHEKAIISFLLKHKRKKEEQKEKRTFWVNFKHTFMSYLCLFSSIPLNRL